MAECERRLELLKPERVDILGFPIDRVTLEQSKNIFSKLLSEPNEKGNYTTNLVLTADSNAFVSAEKDSDYQRIFSEAQLITPDSAGPVWALGRLGKEVPGRVSGVDLLEVLCQLSEETSARIFFLGAAPGIADKAVEKLKEKYPKMIVAGVRDGFFARSEDANVARTIAATSPDILIVAMGMPRQELFILDTAEIIQSKIGIGVGGSLDVHSGMVKRAPKLVQRLGAEWLWRFILNPRKIAKVKNLPIFYFRVRRMKSK
jgi:N-acetylglucosaminyldiphosphoundecaprenol N-acetyl-beta-D-mannosaminyltransferase